MIPSKIYRVRLFFLPQIKDELLKVLHELGVFELTTPNARKLQTNILDKEHSLFSKLEYNLQAVEDGGKLLSVDELAKLLPIIEKKAKQLQELFHIRKNLKARQHELMEKIDDGKLVFTYVPYKKLPKSTSLFAYLIPKSKFDPKILKKFDVSEYYDLGKQFLVVGIADKEPSIEGEKLYVPESLGQLEKYENELKQLNEQIKKIEHEINTLKSDPLLKDAKTSTSIYLERENAKALFGRSKYFYLLEGFVPEKFLEPAIKKLKTLFGDKLHIESKLTKDNAPTYIEVPKMLEGFHRLQMQYGIPSIVDIDPSIFYYLFVPVMFGFIVGDVLYGLIIYLLAVFLEKRYNLKDYAHLWKLGAIWSIIFGIIFNEFLGFTLQDLLGIFGINITFPTLFHRAEHVNEYLMFGIILGYIHLLLAYILGVFKYWILKADLKHTLAKIGWLLLLLSIGVVALNIHTTLAYILGIIGILLIVLGEGIIGILELPSIISNLLSYLRLPVLGLVSVILAGLINSMIGDDLPSIILGVVFVIILHILHALLLVLEASIQAGRLNLVEFRSKFFTGGGRIFKPFMLNKKVIKNDRRSSK